MAEIDYIKFVGGKAYLDTDKLDECFYAIGGSCPGTYERFITRTPDGDHVNVAEIEKAFDAAERERNRTDQLIREEAEKHTKMDKYFFEMDVVQRTFRTPMGIAPLRLIHHNYYCDYNWKYRKEGYDGVRFYFPTEAAYMDFLDKNVSSERIPMCPCPNCLSDVHKEVTRLIKYDYNYSRMTPCQKSYPLNVSWMNVGKEKRAQRRGWLKQPGGETWGGVLNILFLFVVTLVLTWMIRSKGLGAKLMDFSEKYFGYATGFYPIILTDKTRIREWEIVGRDMVLSNDPDIAMQGAGWLALSLATAALIFLHFIYSGWAENRWSTNLLMYPLFLIKGLIAVLFAIPFACFTIPWTVIKSGWKAGKKLTTLLFPGILTPLPLKPGRRDKGKRVANYSAPRRCRSGGSGNGGNSGSGGNGSGGNGSNGGNGGSGGNNGVGNGKENGGSKKGGNSFA